MITVEDEHSYSLELLSETSTSLAPKWTRSCVAYVVVYSDAFAIERYEDRKDFFYSEEVPAGCRNDRETRVGITRLRDLVPASTISRFSIMAQSVPPGHPSVDIWDFINCGKCHRFYSPDSTQPPPLPFWVTNCAHVVCNNHLSEINAS